MDQELQNYVGRVREQHSSILKKDQWKYDFFVLIQTRVLLFWDNTNIGPSCRPSSPRLIAKVIPCIIPITGDACSMQS
ncbi:hypothetical protein Y1Q_0000050 [Alligator mississippiensis]|uniref:Uncharacterized protein n=1 Tax=Alligator mississippiensis TaxID=8496 RepID=A0A151NUF8_ALLMI|nr:hypothetical protein Y1Q_0000050 [Alligator mississippiensis]